jgi:hypothetical protein
MTMLFQNLGWSFLYLGLAMQKNVGNIAAGHHFEKVLSPFGSFL